MIREALFTDETRNFRTPAEAKAGDQVTFRFRAARNDVNEVYFVERDGSPRRMWRGGSDALFDYFEYRLVVPVNSGSAPQTVRLPVWQIGVGDSDRLTRVMLTCAEGYNTGALDLPVKDGCLELELGGSSAVLLVSDRSARNVEKSP